MRLTYALHALILALVLTGFRPARADHFRLALNDRNDQYIADILALALKAEGGNHTLETVPRVFLIQSKALAHLNSPNPRYDVHYSGYTPERAQAYAMVAFPITRGMLGHRLLAVTEKNRELFADVRTLADLRRQAVFASGTDWPDTAILHEAGFKVLTGTDSVLWPMLARGRVNAFPRGINEIGRQIAEEGAGKYGETLVVEPHLMLAYRFDLFFFLPKAEITKAIIIERGMKAAYKSGALDRLLNSEPVLKAIQADLKAHPRRVIHIPNPDMDSRRTGIPDAYWRLYP